MLENPFYHEADSRLARSVYCRLICWALAVALILASILFVTLAHSALVFRAIREDGQPVALRLLTTPCGEKVRAHLFRVKESLRPKFKAAVLTWDGKQWESCWVEVKVLNPDTRKPHGVVFSIDEEGAFFQGVPFRLFRDDSI